MNQTCIGNVHYNNNEFLIRLILLLSIILSFTACEEKEKDIPISQEQKNISHIDLDKTLKNLDIKPKTILCKDKLKNKDEYIPCVEKETTKNTSIENLEFLAGLYVVQKDYDKAINTYEKSIKKGSKKATYILAGLYNEEIKDRVKAKKLFTSIINFKDSTCQIGGILALKDNDDAFEFYEEQIKKGNIKAYACKGLLHIVEKDYTKAKKSYEKLLSLGDKEAYFYLGNLYSAYLGLSGKAIENYEKSALEGNLKSEKTITSMNNLGVESERLRKYDDAIYWFDKALNTKNVDFPLVYKKLNSLTNLVIVFRNKKDENNMIKTLKYLQELGEVGGYLDLAIYYKKEKNYKKAEEIFKECIDKGYGDCAAGLGAMYYRLKKYEKAKKIYLIGVSFENISSMINLAVYYDVVEKNYEKSISLYKKAFSLGSYIAARSLAWLYERELNDKGNAKIWFKKAYDMGDKTLEKKLKKLGVL